MTSRTETGAASHRETQSYAGIVAAARTGDRTAMTKLYEMTSAQVYGSIRALVRDDELAQDVQQETYLRAFTRLDTLRDTEKLLPWLKSIAQNQAKTMLLAKRPLLFSEMVQEDAETAFEQTLPDDDPAAQPERVLEVKDRAEQVRKVLSVLSDGQRMIVGMYYYEQIPIRQIAERLGIAQGTVKAQLHHGRKGIEQELKRLRKQGVELLGMQTFPLLLRTWRQLPDGQQPPRVSALRNTLQELPQTNAGTLTVRSARSVLLMRIGGAAAALLTLAGAAFGASRLLAAQHDMGDVRPPAETETLLASEPWQDERAPTPSGDEEAPDTTGPNEPAPSAEPDEPVATEQPVTEPTAAEPTATQPTVTEQTAAEPIASPSNVDVPATSDTEAAGVISAELSGGMTWQFNEQNGTLTISGSGPMSEPDGSDPEWWYLRSGVKTVVLSDGITSISSSAFWRCDNLVSVTIPFGVTSIGDRAFYECKRLTNITIPSSVTSIGEGAFSYCGLTGVTIPASVASIGNTAFRNCTALSRVTLSDGVTSVGYQAFACCSSLTEITIPGSVTELGREAFAGSGLTSVSIRNGVTSLDNVFADCKSLKSVTIPGSVRSMCYAFVYCVSLNSVTIPDGVKDISSAFGGCSSLASVTIPGSVTNAGAAFEWCTGLTNVTLSNGLTSISGSMFRECRSLTGVTIPASVTGIGEYAFSGCVGLTDVNLPNGMTYIGEGAFSSCSLTGVTIPSGVSHIPAEAFSGCVSLTSVTIPSGVKSIGREAFGNCGSLTSVTIPASVTSIHDRGFYNCPRLIAIYGYEGTEAQRYAEAWEIPFVAL